MSSSVALIVQFVLLGGVFLGSLVAGLVYVRTKGEYGGLIFGGTFIVTFLMGASLWESAGAVLG